LEATPAVAVFGARLPLAERYAELLAGPGVERGLLGPRERDRLWDRHLLNCAVVAELIPPGAHVADLGSGAGLPGVPLALARPDIRMTLIEPMARRTAFLDEVVDELGLTGQVEIRRARADEAAAGRGYDVVTARALAPMARLVPWALPLLRPGGMLLALKGSTVEDELAAFRGADAEIRRVGSGIVDPPTTVVLVRRADRPTRRSRRQEDVS
jgi:16S rRNA (guanine527-N7)-methyltransferase